MNPSIAELTAQIAQALNPEADLIALERTYIGRSGLITNMLRELKDQDADTRRVIAPQLQALRARVQDWIDQHTKNVVSDPFPGFDPTLPALAPTVGGVHPIHAMIREMTAIFQGIGFEVAEGTELVSDTANFADLNMGPEHPARDGHDSFYVTDSLLLRTQTTAAQVIEMKRRKKQGKEPIRVIVPGKTYRRESDQTHAAMFHQIDAVVVDTTTSFAELKGTLDYFVKQLFGDTVETRFRPHHFPFTEPSAEVDIRIKNATGTGKHTQWLEMLGCGMIHPDILRRAGFDPELYRGWAFGTSIERPVMIRQAIPDIRLLTANNAEFLRKTSTFPCA
jgi:phenylalanyl-tRNA synthetase alpha chain